MESLLYSTLFLLTCQEDLQNLYLSRRNATKKKNNNLVFNPANNSCRKYHQDFNKGTPAQAATMAATDARAAQCELSTISCAPPSLICWLFYWKWTPMWGLEFYCQQARNNGIKGYRNNLANINGTWTANVCKKVMV